MLKVKFAVDQVLAEGNTFGWQNVLMVKVGQRGRWEIAARSTNLHNYYDAALAAEEEDLLGLFARLSSRV